MGSRVTAGELAKIAGVREQTVRRLARELRHLVEEDATGAAHEDVKGAEQEADGRL